MSETKTIAEMSTAEIEAVLVAKKSDENKALEKARLQYEKERDEEMSALICLAKDVAEKAKFLKEMAHEKMEDYQIKLNDYGKIRGNSKGGFSLLNTDKTIKIKRRRDTQPTWDERSTKALELIHEFLSDTVKKRDLKLFEILMSFIAKNKKGDLDYASVMNLISHENKFEDKRWKEGLRLIKESYSSYLKGYQYDFEVTNAQTGKFEKIELNFSAL
jgi:hypothetical protein